MKLETELSNIRKDLNKALKREVDTRSLLDGLHKRLGDIEKASLHI